MIDTYIGIDERTRKWLENWQCKFFRKQTNESNKYKQNNTKNKTKNAYNCRNTIEVEKNSQNI